MSNRAAWQFDTPVGQSCLELEVAYCVGGVISPLLANIALHGMEAALGVWRRDGRIRSDRAVVRYADDYVVFCKTREDAEVTLVELAAWLAERGLRPSPSKTRIVHLTEGFDFLGYNVRLTGIPRHGAATSC